MRRLGMAAVSFLLVAAAPASPADVTTAVRIDRAIWLLRDSGVVSRIVDGDDTERPVPLAQSVRPIALCRSGRDLAMPVRTDAGWRIDRWRKNRWRAGRTMSALPGERAIGAACSTGAITILTDRRIIDSRRGARPLTGLVPAISVRTTIYREPDALLVGTNGGEWGGILSRIALRTGHAQRIPGIGDPIHDIAPAPSRPECVVLAIGLVHFLPSGKLVEVCGTRVRRLYARAWEGHGFKAKPVEPGRDPYPSIPFFALARVANATLRAIALDGGYVVASDGTVLGPEAMPRFTARGTVQVATTGDGVELILSGINRRASLSGAMPIVVR